MIYGIEEEDNANWDTTESKVRELLRDRLKMIIDNDLIPRAHGLGRKQQGKHCPIICKWLFSDKKKEVILKNSKKKN